MNPIRIRLAAVVVGVGLVMATPAAAWAATTSQRRPTADTPAAGSSDTTRRDVEAFRARCLAAIDVRLPALSAAAAAVTAHEHLTDEHEAALSADIAETTARLVALAESIKADSDPAVLRQHCRSIFEDNRVFALVLPRVRLVLGADSATAAAGRLGTVAGRLEAAIAEAEAAGRDMTQARADLEAMRAAIASGQASAQSVPGATLGLTPADWNADHTVLDPARASLRSARSDLKAARELAVKILKQLRTPTAPQV